MPLSMNKLQELLLNKGFVASKFFIMDGDCFFIELFSLNSADVFLLYIPSKYTFNMEPGNNAYKIKYIDMNSTDNITDEYAGAPDNMDVAAVYDAGIQLSPGSDKIAEHLEDNYKQQISLKDISKEDTEHLKGIYRQMKRLRYCVQNLKYKIGVVYKNYMCVIRRDDSIDCIHVKHYPRHNFKRLMIIMDLEMFYEKNENVLTDIDSVRNGIYHVLQKNQGSHTRLINKLMENKKDIDSITTQSEVKKKQYDQLSAKLQRMFEIMIKSEKDVMEKIFQLEKHANKGLQSDISRVHQKTQYEKELEKINVVKGEVVKALLQVREKRETAFLSIDKIMFDNTVMFDSMIKNFGMLKGFC